jgi:hypothetical protein
MSFWISDGNAFSARTVFLCLLARAKAARILLRLSNIGYLHAAAERCLEPALAPLL